jgi:tetratricopeptide (TPR) repeat protein
MADVMRVLGAVLLAQRDLAGARRAYERALAIWRDHGVDAIEAADAMDGLGKLAMSQGRHGEAIVQFDAARRVLESRKGERTRARVASILAGLGRAHLRAGHHAEAVAVLDGARTIADSSQVSGHPAMAWARWALAQALWESGDRERARSLAQTARHELASRPGVDEIERWLRRHTASAGRKRPSRAIR